MTTHERLALVTGAASGMGRAFAHRLAADGAKVIGVDQAEMPEDGGLVSYRCDISDPEQVRAMASSVRAGHGEVDILVNAAGIFPQASFADTDWEFWQRVLAVNLSSMYLTCQAFVPSMAERGFGRVVNVSSRTVFVPSAGYSAYISAKAGVIGLTRALATEYGPFGVTANVIAPGLILTEGAAKIIEPERFERLAAQQPVPRVGRAEDVVSAAAFLVAEDSGFFTGQTLVVDGGVVRL